jgi:hypothetical protein
MYPMIVAALGLSAYRSESGSSSAARQRWYFGSQNTDHCWYSRRRLVIRARSSGAGRLVTRVFPGWVVGVPRTASSASMALMQARIGARTGEPSLAPQSQAGGQLAAGTVELGCGQRGDVVVTHGPASYGRPARRSRHQGWPGAGSGPGVGGLSAVERDGCFQVTAVVPQFVGRHAGQGVFRLAYDWGLLRGGGGLHRLAILGRGGRHLAF